MNLITNYITRTNYKSIRKQNNMIMINKTPKLSCGQGPGVIFPLAEENKPDSRVN